jgi:hypothetical protein
MVSASPQATVTGQRTWTNKLAKSALASMWVAWV